MSRRDVGTELYIRAAATCSEKPGHTEMTLKGSTLTQPGNTPRFL
jgi:hypothetical protein